jgi:hypothetical protein
MDSKKYKEEFENNESPKYKFFYIFHLIIGLFAIYLSFKCNNGFNLGSFLIALFCPVFYILYKFVVPHCVDNYQS